MFGEIEFDQRGLAPCVVQDFATGEVLIPTAEALGAYLAEQKLTPPVLIGHWLGGSFTLHLAERRPERLRKALIVDAAPFVGAMQSPPQATIQAMRPQAERARARILAAGQPPPETIEPEMGASCVPNCSNRWKRCTQVA